MTWLFICGLLARRISLLCFLPSRKTLSRPGENPRRLSPRTQRRRLRKPARSQLRIQSRQSPRRRLHLAEIFPAGRSRHPPGRDRPPGKKSRTSKRNPILNESSPCHPERSEVLREAKHSTQSKDPMPLNASTSPRKEFSPHSVRPSFEQHAPLPSCSSPPSPPPKP